MPKIFTVCALKLDFPVPEVLSHFGRLSSRLLVALGYIKTIILHAEGDCCYYIFILGKDFY